MTEDHKSSDNELEGADNGVEASPYKFEQNSKELIYEHDEVTKEKNKIQIFLSDYRKQIRSTFLIILNILIGGYFAWATYYFIENENFIEIETNPNDGICTKNCGWQWCDGYGMLLILSIFIYFWLFYFLIFKRYFGKKIKKLMNFERTFRGISRLFRYRMTKIITIGLVLLLFIGFVVVDTLDSQERLQSVAGIVILLAVGYIFSKHRSNIQIRPVVFGLIFQFLLGMFCIRWKVGRDIFKCIGDKIATFFLYANDGKVFVFGDLLVNVENVFAFSVMPVVFFFSSLTSVLYYYGAMQWVIKKIGWILQVLLGTTVCESVICAANIFLGMSESPFLIKPYIKFLTNSEMHAVMVSGYATVSGSSLAAYTSLGAEPAHLIVSSVMAAPATLFFAKLFYPETEKSKTTTDNLSIENSDQTSALDAASSGAVAAIAVVWGVIANVVAFISFVAFLNGATSWFGALVGYEELTFEWIFAKLFIPMAWILGIPWEDCEKVAEVLSAKIVINEFVAYQRMGILKANQLISLRSSAICTFAICSYSNPASLAIYIGNLSILCPEKRPAIVSVAVRAVVAGCIVSFISASIAGLLMTEEIFNETGRSMDLVGNFTQI